MRAALLVLLLAAAPGDEAVTIERSVRLTLSDPLNRRREIQRRERVTVKDGNLAIADLTFGERLVVRTDRKRIVRIDTLGGVYSEYGFEEAAAIRKRALDEIESAKARVPGTADEKELEAVLEGFDRFAKPPAVELRSEGNERRILLNGDRVRFSARVDEKRKAAGLFAALAAADAFPPAVAEKLKGLDGLPVQGTIRYALFLDRVVEQFEVTSVRPGEAAEADFEVPAGLVQVPLAGFERPAEREPARDGKKP
jgi:hypothetical protein